MKESRMKWKNLSLTTKIAMLSSILLIVIFGGVITFTVYSTKQALEGTIKGEFNYISKSNGLQVQQIVDAGTTAITDMETYLLQAYKMSEQGIVNMAGETSKSDADRVYKSLIYGVPITEMSQDVEVYVTQTAKQVAAGNADIYSVGMLFEPYCFDTNIEGYSFYLNEDQADKGAVSYGGYEDYSKQTYYTMAKEQKRLVVTDPYVNGDKTMVMMSKPIFYNNEFKGVICVEINTARFSKIDAVNKEFKTMYSTIYNSNQVIVYDTDDVNDIGKEMASFYAFTDELATVESLIAKGEAFHTQTTRESGVKVSRYFYPIKVGENTWWALTSLETRDMNAAVTRTSIWLLMISVAALVVIVGIIFFVLKKMLHPIRSVMSAAQSISKGDLDIHLDSKTNDEIAKVSRAFDETALGMRRIIGDISYMLNEMADGNFDIKTKAEESYIGDFKPILLSIRNINSRLSEALRQINTASDQVSSGSEQVASGSQALAQGATEQASAVEELAATVTKIEEQVVANAENADTARVKAINAGKEVTTSNEKMKEMMSAISEISDKSGEINKIIKTIEDIAFQTNILALNAAVEAARAGAAGKGFAVVADEVRSLANKSREAANNTTALIEETIKAVNHGNEIAEDTAAAMTAVVNGTSEVTKLVDRISSASNEQAAAIKQVTMGIDQISSVVQTNSATAEQSAAASEELSGQAQLLKDQAGRFRLKQENGAQTLPGRQQAYVREQSSQQEIYLTDHEKY